MDDRLRRGMDSRSRRIPEEWAISKFIPNGPPRAMYDLGVGCFYEFRTLKVVYPHLQVFGCEPCPAEYEALLPIFTGKLLPVAIGAESGKRALHLTELGQGGSALQPQIGESRLTVEVDVWTLDQFDEWAGRPDMVLLWMDIEGSELDALRGGTALLKSGRVHWMNIETRDDTSDPCLTGHPNTAQINEFLKPYGYVPIHRYNVQGAYPAAAGDVIYFKKGVVPNMADKCNWGVQVG